MDKKRVIRILKRNALYAGALFTAWIGNYQANAYVWVNPSKPETSVATIPGLVNSANITYRTPNLETGVTGQLGIFGWQGNSTPYTASVDIFDDQSHSVFLGGYTGDKNIDVIIGNGVSPARVSDYRAGVVYTNTAGNIMLNVYDVTNVGTAGMAATLYTTLTVATAGSGVTYSNPHIDIIEEVGITSTNNNFTGPVPTPLGLPNCSRFIITYQDNNGNVYGYYNDLNFTVTPASTSFLAASLPYQTPDVAAIQYYIGGGVHDYARFTWADNQNNIYEAEWDVATGVTTPPIPILPVSAPDAYYYPRIDAIDDYTTNNNPAQANYEIVTDAYISGARGVVTYNNLNTFNCTLPFLSGAINYSSCVAAGPGSKYSVAYYTTHNGVTAIQNIDYSTGLLSNSNYYQVNNIGAAGNPYRVSLCISASCNDGRYLLVGYCYNLAALTYKYTSNSIAFKPSGVNTSLAAGNVTIFPNPTTDNIQVDGAQPGDSYTITDLSGKQASQGTITDNRQTINVSGLAPGIYFLEAHSATGRVYSKFVKQ